MQTQQFFLLFAFEDGGVFLATLAFASFAVDQVDILERANLGIKVCAVH